MNRNAKFQLSKRKAFQEQIPPRFREILIFEHIMENSRKKLISRNLNCYRKFKLDYGGNEDSEE